MHLVSLGQSRAIGFQPNQRSSDGEIDEGRVTLERSTLGVWCWWLGWGGGQLSTPCPQLTLLVNVNNTVE